MSKKKNTKDRLNETILEMATGLYDIKAIDSITMREYESLHLPEVHDFSPKEIKRLRLREKVSQAVFAKLLNTTVNTISAWEQGKKHPRGTSLKLLNLVADNGLAVLC